MQEIEPLLVRQNGRPVYKGEALVFGRDGTVKDLDGVLVQVVTAFAGSHWLSSTTDGTVLRPS